MKKWARRLFKIIIILFVILAVVLTMMVNMGGNSPTLKSALENYISGSTGYTAQIETLNKMSFYPMIGFDIENVQINHPTDRTKGISVERAVMKLGFWDVMLSRRTLRVLLLENAVFSAGTLLDKPAHIQELSLDETPDGQSYLGLNGTITDTPITAKIILDAKGDASNRRYNIGEESLFEATLGARGEEISIQAALRPRALGGFHVRDFLLRHKDNDVLSGAFYLMRDPSRMMELKGTLKSIQTDAETDFDFILGYAKGLQLTGTLNANLFTMEDFTQNSRLMQTIGVWQAIIAPPVMDIDLTLLAQRFVNDENTQNDASLILTRENEQLSITQNTGEKPEGNLEGNLEENNAL